MKTILKKTFPYILIFVLANFACYYISDFYKQERKYLDRIEFVTNSNSEVIFLGDSHLESIKQLNLNKDIGNLAFGGDGIDEMYIKTLIMLNSNSNLKYAFISTEPQTFNNTLSANSTFLNGHLLKVKDTLNVFNKSTLNLITERVPLLNDNYIRYILNNIYAKLRGKKGNVNKKEWQDLSNVEKEAKAIKTGQLDHNSIMTNTSYLETYKKTIDLLKLNNIKVIGIRFPVYKNYINQCKEEDLKKVDSFIHSLNLDKYIDYSLKITKPELFNDEDHLNTEGVKILSKIILKETGINLSN